MRAMVHKVARGVHESNLRSAILRGMHPVVWFGGPIVHMETILITGGAGFIGGTFVRALLAKERRDPSGDVRIVNLDLLTYSGNLGSLASVMADPRHVFVRGDIGDRALLRAIFREHKPSKVVHFAAESHVDRSIDGPRKFVDTNVTGTVELLIAAVDHLRTLPASEQRAFRFLQVSTDEVYGSMEDGYARESDRYAPSSPYSASKAAADCFARAFSCTYGLPVIWTISSNNYGPYQFPEKLIPLIVKRALEGKSLPVYGDGSHVRDWLFAEDHTEALRRVLWEGQPGETYHVASGCEKTNLEVIQAVCKSLEATGAPLPKRPLQSLITFVPDRPGHDRRYALDCKKIRDELGWAPKVTFEQGILLTVGWATRHREHFEAYGAERLGTGTSFRGEP